MKKVFITGRGLVTPLGRGRAVNEKALREGASGVVFCPEWAEHGLASNVAGLVDIELESEFLDRKRKRFMAPNSAMAVLAVEEALAEANLTPDDLAQKRIAVISGVAGTSYKEIYDTAETFSATRANTQSQSLCCSARDAVFSGCQFIFGFRFYRRVI